MTLDPLSLIYDRSLLQNLICFRGLFCKRDLSLSLSSHHVPCLHRPVSRILCNDRDNDRSLLQKSPRKQMRFCQRDLSSSLSHSLPFLLSNTHALSHTSHTISSTQHYVLFLSRPLSRMLCPSSSHQNLSFSCRWHQGFSRLACVLQRVAVCRIVLQCVAECCSVLPCVAVCCSVLQRVAACCSVLQCVAVVQVQGDG